jgi:hypothetical protein
MTPYRGLDILNAQVQFVSSRLAQVADGIACSLKHGRLITRFLLNDVLFTGFTAKFFLARLRRLLINNNSKQRTKYENTNGKLPWPDSSRMDSRECHLPGVWKCPSVQVVPCSIENIAIGKKVTGGAWQHAGKPFCKLI